MRCCRHDSAREHNERSTNAHFSSGVQRMSAVETRWWFHASIACAQTRFTYGSSTRCSAMWCTTSVMSRTTSFSRSCSAVAIGVM